MPRPRTLLILWLAAFALALAADRPLAGWVHNSGLSAELKNQYHWLTRSYIGVARIPGDFLTFTLPAAILLLAAGPRYRRGAGMVFLAGLLSASNALVKWLVGRPRPFQGTPGRVFEIHPFVDALHGLGGANQSFPSGDVTLAVATAICLCRVVPRGWPLWLLLVVEIAAERIAEGAHYPSDCVAAVALGWLLAKIAGWAVGWAVGWPAKRENLKFPAPGGV